MAGRLILSLAAGVVFYFAGFFGTLILQPLVSSNTHDGSIEAAMTGAFLSGPLTTLAGFLTCLMLTKRKP
jgi:hypothetical protein